MTNLSLSSTTSNPNCTDPLQPSQLAFQRRLSQITNQLVIANEENRKLRQQVNFLFKLNPFQFSRFYEIVLKRKDKCPVAHTLLIINNRMGTVLTRGRAFEGRSNEWGLWGRSLGVCQYPRIWPYGPSSPDPVFGTTRGHISIQEMWDGGGDPREFLIMT